jgi:hypothetical protein
MAEPHLPPPAPRAGAHEAPAMAGPAARSLALAYALHAAIKLTGSFDRNVGELGAISADLVRELHALDRRLSSEAPARIRGA